MNKTQRLKLPKYLATVAKYVPYCVECGTTEGVQNAHYSGLYSERLGNGMGSKSHDYCVARLCHKCHAELDQYQHGNGDMRARWFIGYIWETLMDLKGVKSNSIAVPKDLKEQQWLDQVANRLTKLMNGESSIAASELINKLARERKYVEKNGQ